MRITREQARDMAEAHAGGMHDELARDGCPECETRELREYPLECEGHPAGPFAPMGETVYCDGSCR